MWLFFAFLIVPLIEITLFIQIGGAIGLGWTLFTVVLTAILGTWLVRSQGLAVMQQLRGNKTEYPHDQRHQLSGNTSDHTQPKAEQQQDTYEPIQYIKISQRHKRLDHPYSDQEISAVMPKKILLLS